MEKRTYTVPVGPQHPALIEPENFILKVDGETVVDVEVNVGYIHRGIEELMQRKNYQQNIFLAERICGICSHIHTTTYCQLVERLMDLEIPERAKYIRTIVSELERLHSHLLWLGIAGYEIGLDTVFMYVWKDREVVMDILEEISGNRVNYGMNTIGGARRDISRSSISRLLKAMEHLKKRLLYYANIFTKDDVIVARTRNIGVLRKSDALKYCIVGPVARASGVRSDVRRDSPYAAYDLVDWKVVVARRGDVQARAVVRIKELLQSIKIIKECCRKMPSGEIRTKPVLVVPENEAVCRTEAYRGELFYYGRSNGTDKPERIKVRTPTYANLLSLKPMLKNAQLADVPIIIASIDPCFSCNDRMTLVDVNSESIRVVESNELRRMRK